MYTVWEWLAASEECENRRCRVPWLFDMRSVYGWILIFCGQVYAILDEVFLAGEIEETSKQVVLTRLEHLDKLE